jgi:hypothetical protein
MFHYLMAAGIEELGRPLGVGGCWAAQVLQMRGRLFRQAIFPLARQL